MIDNVHLYELINAGPALAPWPRALATVVAQWLIYLVPAAMVLAWVRGDTVARRDLLEMLLATSIALALGQVITHIWPQLRPAAVHLGTQYLRHANDPGLPSDHVLVFWSLALAALSTRRLAVWCFPLLSAGLAVGWSRVFLGVHFPFDVLAALPVALVAALTARAVRVPLAPFMTRCLGSYERVVRGIRDRRAATRHV